MANNILQRFNIRGIIAVLVVLIGFYMLHDKETPNDVKMAVIGLMGTVLGYYFVSSERNKKKDDNENK